MSKGQRLGFLAVAAVIAVVAAIVLGTGGGDEDQSQPAATQPAATATPEGTATPGATAEETATETPTPSPTPEPPPLLRPGRVTELEAEQGDTVRFRVRSPVAEHVHVHGYDVLKDVPAGRTVTVSFKATITGIFEIELENSHQQLAKLTVNP